MDKSYHNIVYTGLIFCLLAIAVTMAKAQKPIVSFTSGNDRPEFHYFLNGHISKENYPFKIIIIDGVTCGELIKAKDSHAWSGIYTDLEAPVDMLYGKMFSVDVLMYRKGTFTLKLEGSYDGGEPVQITVVNTKPGQWETLHFDFSSMVKAFPSYHRLTLFADLGKEGADKDHVTYFKNILQYPGKLPTGTQFKEAVKIVVLGSSTAAGMGPDDIQDAWVWRYRKHLQQKNIFNKVINLAKGGYTTYHLLPSGSTPGAGKPLPDPQRNITKAVSLHPDAILINLPSNDAALGYSAAEQMQNYRTMVAMAKQNNIPVYISTPQGRNMPKKYRDIQIALKDSVFIAMQNKTLDFWTGIAMPGGTIIPKYDSGDGIHLNKEGHKLLFEEVKNKKIYFLINSKRKGIEIQETPHDTPLNYPGYKLVWQDEFDKNFLNYHNWSYELGDGCPLLCGWGNDELVYYRPENVRVKDGQLIITAMKDKLFKDKYSSGRIITKNKVHFQYGRMDIRAKLPGTKGLWPAFWLHGADWEHPFWPESGEIDIMEAIGHIQYRITGAIHYQNKEGKHQFQYRKYELLENKFSDDYHIFSIIWDKDKIQWLVDNNKYFEISFDQLNLAGNPFRHQFYLIINLAVGGTLPGNPDRSTVLPQELKVDYIRFFTPL